MEVASLADIDVIHLSVGGQHICTTRQILIQAPHSMLALCFGSAWARYHKLDDQGCVVLDLEPYCFQQIVSFLTHKLHEQPNNPVPQPVIQQEAKAEYEALVDYLQLKDYMALTVADFRFNKTIGMSLTLGGHAAEASGKENVCLPHQQCNLGACTTSNAASVA